MEASPQLVKACFSRVVWVPPHYKLHSEDRSDGGMVMQTFPMCHILVPRPVKWEKKHTESQEWKTKLYPLPFYPDFLVSTFLVSPLLFLCSDQNNNNIKVPYFLVNLYAFSHSPVGYEGSGWHGYLLTCPSSCLVSPGWDVSGSSCLDDAPQTVIHVPTLPLTAALHFLLKFSFITVIQPLNTDFNLFQENKFSSALDVVAIGWSVSILGRDIDYFF